MKEKKTCQCCGKQDSGSNTTRVYGHIILCWECAVAVIEHGYWEYINREERN